MVEFDPEPVLRYLDLPATYEPSPRDQPLVFLRFNLAMLPASLLTPFSSLLSPEDRAIIPLIRNRRLAYAQTAPRQLMWERAVKHEPGLWASLDMPHAASAAVRVPRPGEEEGKEEREWAEREFMGRDGPEGKGAVGNIARLLGGFEEERVGEFTRDQKRARARRNVEELPDDDDMDNMEEVEEEEEDDEDDENGPSLDAARARFERLIRERYITGGLDWADYDADWDDTWDTETARDMEDRWFDDDEDEDET